MEQTHSALKHTWHTKTAFLIVALKRVKPVVFSPLFFIPLFVKCVTAFFLASPLTADLFVPFVHFFITKPLDNPYQHFYDIGQASAFPYPFGMLLIISFLYALFGTAAHTLPSVITHLDIFLLRIPLLLADIGILFILISWFRSFKKEVLILYWASPILFYISYVHGQLDVIPMFFLFAFLFLLTKEKDYTAFILLGLAIATKTGMVIILPFIALYLLKERKDKVESFAKMLIPGIVFYLVNAHVLFTPGFIAMVFKTKEEFSIVDLVIRYNSSIVLYVVPGIVLLLLFSFSMLKRYSRNVLMVFLGFSFFVLLLCIPPKQGWYFWIIPFAVYFYAQKPWRSWFPLHLVSLTYFIYFALIKESDFSSLTLSSHLLHKTPLTLYEYGTQLGMPMEKIVSLAFTFLQSALLLNIYIIYKNGIAFYTKNKLNYKPFLLGIAGDSGSGKTTLTELLTGIFRERNTAVIAGDDMHKWERGDDMWQDYTHLDPLANELHSDIKNIYAIKQGKTITRRHYDHATGKFTEPKTYEAKRLVIFEGLHVFFLDKVRKAFDLKIYVAPEDQLRLHWKIIRDSEKRGYTKEQILSILEKRKDDSEKFIAVQEKHSDVVFSLRNNVSLGKNLGEKDFTLALSLFITCANDIYVQPLLDELIPFVTVDYLIHDEKQRIKFSGDIDSLSVQNIAEKLLPELDDISSERREWASGYHGIMQLFTVFYIFKMLTLDEYDK